MQNAAPSKDIHFIRKKSPLGKTLPALFSITCGPADWPQFCVHQASVQNRNAYSRGAFCRQSATAPCQRGRLGFITSLRLVFKSSQPGIPARLKTLPHISQSRGLCRYADNKHSVTAERHLRFAHSQASCKPPFTPVTPGHRHLIFEKTATCAPGVQNFSNHIPPHPANLQYRAGLLHSVPNGTSLGGNPPFPVFTLPYGQTPQIPPAFWADIVKCLNALKTRLPQRKPSRFQCGKTLPPSMAAAARPRTSSTARRPFMRQQQLRRQDPVLEGKRAKKSRTFCAAF